MSIVATNMSAGYAGFMLKSISLEIAAGSFTALIGPNGCGKSTLLRALSRTLPLRSGTVTVGGADISTSTNKAVAQKLAILPQSPITPASITVKQLVGYGRAPHQNLLGMRSSADVTAIETAIEKAGLQELRNQSLSDLSGGQRQRAFIAMCLAQDTQYLLLDEPTSYLDIKYQFETLQLLSTLRNDGKTIVVVLHDIAQAARFADTLIIMHEGAVFDLGQPRDMVTPKMLAEVYGVRSAVFPDPETGTPVVTVLQ